MSTQLASIPPGYDTSSDVARVVEATRHLHDFRSGFAQALAWAAEENVDLMPDTVHRLLEPMLRILGPERAQRFAERIDRIARDVAAEVWPAGPETPRIVLEKVCDEAAHAVADEFLYALMVIYLYLSGETS